jgi:hypothetical protein
LKENSDEIHPLNAFMAHFYLKNPSSKEFSARRIPYHFDKAALYKELVTYLRSQESRLVTRQDRQTYLRVRIFYQTFQLIHDCHCLETSLSKSAVSSRLFI